MIIRSRVVVTMDGPPIENGAVVVDGPIIRDVGTFHEIAARNTGEIIDLGEQALLPGLINAHCHLDYTILRGKIPAQSSFTDWIRRINERKAALSEEDYLASIADGFAEAKRFGTTSIVNLETCPQLIGKIGPSQIRTWWCPEMIDVRERIDVERALNGIRRDASSREDPVGGIGLAPHAPYTASPNLYTHLFDSGATRWIAADDTRRRIARGNGNVPRRARSSLRFYGCYRPSNGGLWQKDSSRSAVITRGTRPAMDRRSFERADRKRLRSPSS